ncbi:MAG: tagaturonate epimerase family protein [Balneolaceae bacterium]
MVNGMGAQHLGNVQQLLAKEKDLTLYESSLHEHEGILFGIVRRGIDKLLLVWPVGNGSSLPETEFQGERSGSGDHEFLLCECTHAQAEAIRKRFEFTRPVLVGKVNSYGLGDRLGNAGPAHIRAIRETGFRPVLAQQSIRELERTRRTAEEVMDAATWSVFQEGYHEGFGADGDHLKTTDDLDRMVEARYTMFTIDPSDYVVNKALAMKKDELLAAFQALPWDELDDSPDLLLGRYNGLDADLGEGNRLQPDRAEVLQGMVKYGKVIAHTRMMAEYLKKTWPDHPAELELSVDETDEPTTLFEHYLVASELSRLGVELVSLAPRFCGDFEKGIDFKGDLEQFREEYLQHLAIAALFGGYKLSVHSGSDKFSVYRVVGSLRSGAVHVKTAGTSYLEALRTVAVADPGFFREIMSFSLTRFEEDKKTYHISADVNRIPDPATLKGAELTALLDDDHTRQVLHVAYGSVLSGEQPQARTWKKRLMQVLEENEELHMEHLVRHFEKHLEPFGDRGQV